MQCTSVEVPLLSISGFRVLRQGVQKLKNARNFTN
jgi:hypothetical protein